MIGYDTPYRVCYADTIIKEIPKVKFRLISEIYNEKMELINEGEVTLGFMDAATGKPRRAPDEFTEILERTGKFL